jgi:hypothetical protein
MANNLGPFQDIWEAWEPAQKEMCAKSIDHFEKAVAVQFVELKQHRNDENDEKAAQEAIDIISIALNLLRNLGYEPEKIAKLARARARNRIAGKTSEILAKYDTP